MAYLMVKNAAGKDDVSNIFHSTGIPSGKYNGFYRKNML